MSEVVFGSHLDLDSNEIRNARLLNLTSGTAPGTPADGDVWTTTSGIYARINGATVGPLLGSTVWGTVTGTLSDQTDLQSALDLKAPLASPTFTGTVSLSTLTADTINGRDPDDLVLGPASATDNALVRFDGTGGKTVQDTPGLTVNDSGFITSDLVVSKASPNLYSLASSGNSTFYLASVAGATCQFVLRTGSFSNRWIFGKEGTAESGSNAGSNFTLMSYDDAGVLLRTDLTITRSTGAVTLAGTLAVTDTTDATSHITGSVKLSGGMGIAKKLYVGTDLNVAGIPTFTGTNVYHSVTGSATDFITGTQYGTLKITSGVGYTSSVVFNAGTTAGSGQRWLIFKDESTESGSNVGSDLMIRNYSDAGAYISTPLTITRSTGAVTLTGTLNGKIVNDLVTGPASATDNALVRFDNTTGKVVQNSGITVNDSGYITSDVTMSKASPILSVSASTQRVQHPNANRRRIWPSSLPGSAA
jgi:hypothetical protein